MGEQTLADVRAERAHELFRSGYNCAQSVCLAFADLAEERGIAPDTLARIASPFGGGMGRLREVCGAVSGSLIVLGICCGYDEARDYAAKRELYARVQEVAGRYRDEQGSIVCRELLGLGAGPSDSAPEKRSEAYYKKRPCAELCRCAARTLAELLDAYGVAGAAGPATDASQ